jgi:hypothetical protein
LNARHAHDLIRVKFPTFVATEHEWQLVAHGEVGDAARIEVFLRANFSNQDLVVRVSRKVGGLLPVSQVAALAASSIGLAEIRIANREFTEFAVLGHPGVATAWKRVTPRDVHQTLHQPEPSQGAA